MSKQTVFLVGATGETGESILQALLDDGSFDVTCFIRLASAQKPAVQRLRDKGLKVVTGELSDSPEKLAELLVGIDTVILSIFAFDVGVEAPLIQAASMAHVKRFVPCGFGTPCPRGGIMALRDLKEEVHDKIFASHLGFTIIDVGYWYEISFPRVPSGKFDYAAMVPRNIVIEGGTAPNMLIAKKDVGSLTAKIIKDDRTLNKRVFVCGDILTQNEINAMVEEKTGEKLALTTSAEDVRKNLEAMKRAVEEDPSNLANKYRLSNAQYNFSKYVRGDNTPEMAEYLGYIDGRKLYPDYQFQKFSGFVDDLAAGKVQRPYPHVSL